MAKRTIKKGFKGKVLFYSKPLISALVMTVPGTANDIVSIVTYSASIASQINRAGKPIQKGHRNFDHQHVFN